MQKEKFRKKTNDIQKVVYETVFNIISNQQILF